MSSYVGAELRSLVASRANHLCEYCLIHEDDTYLGCQVDHIISQKHGGSTDPTNLAYACAYCNRAKGSDIGSIASSTGELTRLFNPRIDRWGEHFVLQEAAIQGLTPIGEVTAQLLLFNAAERKLEREVLHQTGRYPPEAASKLLSRRGT